jgi:RND family efflux transporter MFP subunit
LSGHRFLEHVLSGEIMARPEERGLLREGGDDGLPGNVDALRSALAFLSLDAAPPANRPGSRAWIWWLCGLFVCGLGAFAAHRIGASRAAVFQVAVSSIASPAVAVGSTLTAATGYVVALRTARVGAPREGRIGALYVAQGDHVEAGEALARLENWEERGRVAKAAAQLQAATAREKVESAELQGQQQQLRRSAGLAEIGAVSRASLEETVTRELALQARAQAASADVTTSAAELAAWRERLSRTTVEAPIAGTVVTKPLQLGESVTAATIVAELVDLNSLVVETEVAETRLSTIRIGAPCEIILDAQPDKRHAGIVKQLGHSVDRSKATSVIRVRFIEAPAELLPGMAARVAFLADTSSERSAANAAKPVLPAAAVVRRDERQIVYIVEADGSVREKDVQLGRPVQGGYELLSGPPAGTRVVLNPPTRLTDGATVTEKERS